MTADAGSDQLAIFRVEGMHCHKCEQTIRKVLYQNEGVHEVEVDFLSGQASVLFDHQRVAVDQLAQSIQEAGYRVTGFTQGHAGRASSS